MAHYPKLCFSLLLLLGAVNYCKSQSSNQRKTHPKECIELNNRGVKCLMNAMNDEKELNQAIVLFKEAIVCDSTYLIPYMNLANAYNQKKVM